MGYKIVCICQHESTRSTPSMIFFFRTPTSSEKHDEIIETLITLFDNTKQNLAEIIKEELESRPEYIFVLFL